MPSPKLTFYIDIVSPFAYLAFAYLQRSAAFKSVDITYVPVFLGGIMKATDNRPPLAIKNKDKWINAERKRLAARFNIPVAETAPEGFPANTINVQRVLAAIETHHPAKLVPAINALYNAYWLDRRPITDVAVYGGAVSQVLGEAEGKKMLELAGTKEIKDKLQKNTTLAVESGAFGLPYFIATDSQGRTEGFWGFEHLALVAEHLGVEKERAML